ncbi:MAG: hypothetical protein WCH07_12270, partial [Deltaproteobacteria bacterium]
DQNEINPFHKSLLFSVPLGMGLSSLPYGMLIIRLAENSASTLVQFMVHPVFGYFHTSRPI